MEKLLNLAFFLSVGFKTKTDGIAFLKQNPKLKKCIEEKVNEIEDVKEQIIDDIKEKLFPKYDSQKAMFLMEVKCNRIEKKNYKKELEKQALKNELRAELREEIKNEEIDENKMKLKKNYPNAYPIINNDLIEQLPNLEHLFNTVLKQIDNEDINTDQLSIVEKQKIQVEKALGMLKKSIAIMNKINS